MCKEVKEKKLDRDSVKKNYKSKNKFLIFATHIVLLSCSFLNLNPAL